MKSLIVNSYGQNYEVKSATAPNLDPGFWLTDSGNDVTLENILNQPDIYQVWVRACIRAIASNVSQVDRFIRRVNSQERMQNSKAFKLLRKPNQLMDMVSFFYLIVCYLLLPSRKNEANSGGQCFIIPWNGEEDEPVYLNKGEIPSELMVLSEQFFTPWKEKNERGLDKLKGWTFELPGIIKSKINFEFGQLIRIYVPNPHDLLKGINDFTSIYQTINTDATADTFNNNLFKNNGRLDGLVKTDQILGKEQLDEIKAEWYKQYSGPKQKKVAFLYGGMEYQQFGSSSMDLGYIDQGKWNRQKVLAAFGLNRIAIGDYEDINYATIREGRKILWYDRYIPLDKLITRAFNGQWINFVDNGTSELSSDYSGVPALQADLKERAEIAGVLCDKLSFPPVIAARITNIQLTEEELQKYPHLSEYTPKQPVQIPMTPEPKAIIKSFDRTGYSKEYVKSILEPAERKYRDALNEYFILQRNSIMDKIDAHVKSMSIIKEIHVWDFFPDEVKEDLKAIGTLKNAIKLQAALEKKQVENELGHNVDWTSGLTKIDYWVSVRAQYVKDINTTTFRNARDAINAVVKQGTDEGITVGEMRTRIKNAVHDVYQVRLGRPVEPNGLFDLGGMSSSKTIARTEMGNIASWTRADIFKVEGIKKIEWVTAHDSNVRHSHAELDGKTAIFGHAFEGSELRYPRDPDGSAEEVINCRCSYIAVMEDEE